ncbi:MAG: hypothetical protein AAFZ65_21125, partial [Planctomycetota bacterium]
MMLTPSLALVACSAVAPGGPIQEDLPREVVLVPLPEQATWEESAFLAAVPAAAALAGEPWVLAVDPAAPWRPELVDFLGRLEVTRAHWLGEVSPPGGPALGPDEAALRVDHVPTADGFAASLALMDLGWSQANRVVLVDGGDSDLSHVAAALAGRLVVPLMIDGTEADADVLAKSLAELGVGEVVQVGPVAAALADAAGREGRIVTELADSTAAIRWLEANGHPVGYLALANPRAEGAAPPNALAAPALAAGRGGALVPLGEAAIWKAEHPTDVEGAPDPAGVPGAARDVRRGSARLMGRSIPFVTSHEGASHCVRLDLDGDGRVDGPAEG